MTAAQRQYGGRKIREGTVVSDKMQKTVLVAVETNFRHRLYKKTVRRVRRLMAHDESEDARMGDRVRIVEASPISRHKRWRLVEVLTRAELPEVAPESIDLELLGEIKREEEVEEAAAPSESDAVAVEPEAISRPEAEAVAPDEIEIEEMASEEAVVVEPEAVSSPETEAVAPDEIEIEEAVPVEEPPSPDATPDDAEDVAITTAEEDAEGVAADETGPDEALEQDEGEVEEPAEEDAAAEQEAGAEEETPADAESEEEKPA